MKTERKKMYRRVPERIVIAYFNDKVIAYVNAGIAYCAGSSSEGSANTLFWMCTRAMSLDADSQNRRYSSLVRD